MVNDHYDEKYTDPKLRRQLKEEIKQSDKGGKPGQWSARKSQHLVQEYEKHGGGYKDDQKDEAARSLEQWSDEEWQTETGKNRARQRDVSHRYLPKDVWAELTEAEKQEAEKTKKASSERGEQYVEWTPAIKRAVQDVREKSESRSISDRKLTKQNLYDQAKELNIPGRSKMRRRELQEAIEDAKHRNL